MRASFLCANLLVCCLLLASCATQRRVGTELETAPLLQAESVSQSYNMQFDLLRHHFSGLLVVRRMPGDEIRLLASTYFGPSLFDLSLRADTFTVNSCVPFLRRKKLLRLLETDFKNLFLSGRGLHRKGADKGGERLTAGCGMARAVFRLSDFEGTEPRRVKIRHPWLRLTIQLEKLQK